jgi:hypothetical protein
MFGQTVANKYVNLYRFIKYTFMLSVIIIMTGFSEYDNQVAYQEPTVSGNQLKEWVSYLASDQMRGRQNGSPEMKIAAMWLSERFREMGLQPFESLGGYIQDYTYSAMQNAVSEKNIIGFLPGSNPSLKDEYLILSAHFDHIGINHGNLPDSIFNGADDNAAGTATLLGIARTIQESGLKPGRSIIFAAFSGEENGMRGSRYFVTHLPISAKNIYADVNFEMTGHSEFLGKRKYYMTGCRNSNLDDLIKEFDKNTDFQLIDTIPVANNLFYASDNISFSLISTSDGISTGIPSGTFATTAIAPYVHSISDEVGLFDFDNMADLVGHFSKVILWLSNSRDQIKWTVPEFVRPE